MRIFKRFASLILVMALAFPAAVFAEKAAVAENVQTGAVYTDLQTALNVMEKGQTVKLLADTQSDDVFVGPGETLDLNGHVLTAELFSAPFDTSHVIDSQNSQGLLIVTGSYAFNRINKQLPVWTSEGARFADVSIKTKLQPVDDNTATYKFYLNMHSGDTILDDILKDGSTGTGITIRIRIRYSLGNGVGTETPFVLSDALVKQYVEAWDKNMVILNVKGLANKLNVKFITEVVSTAPNGTSVIVSA